ncbi:MAG: hypothetical protein NTW87_28335 [Planctomycetota bacterium]|nr:hypothetical protein [Planctomycetota bacterium]
MLLPTPLAQDEALRALAEIRAAVDRSARYSTFSALSGFIAGGAAFVGSGVCGAHPGFAGAQPAAGWPFVAVWSGVLAVTALALAVLTAMKARRRGEAVWTPIARTAFAALLGPGMAGLASSAALALTGRFEMLPGLWLVLYGCGLWAVSFFAPLFLRVLGVAFMILGLCAWSKMDCAALWLGLGFGGLHVLFGAVVLARYHK